MTISVFHYEAEPGGGYVEPFPVACYFDFPHTMTVLQSDDPRVVDFVGNGGTIEPYEAPAEPEPYVPTTPSLIAMGQVKIADGDVSEVKISAALAGSFLFGEGELWCFFVEEQPDTDYIVLAYDSNTVRAFVEDEDKSTGYFIIRVTDFDGVPTNPASLNFEVKRVI